MNIHNGPFEQKEKKENKDLKFIESKGTIYETFLRTNDRVFTAYVEGNRDQVTSSPCLMRRSRRIGKDILLPSLIAAMLGFS